MKNENLFQHSPNFFDNYLCTTLAVMKSLYIRVKHFVLYHTVKLPISKKFLKVHKLENFLGSDFEFDSFL